MADLSKSLSRAKVTRKIPRVVMSMYESVYFISSGENWREFGTSCFPNYTPKLKKHSNSVGCYLRRVMAVIVVLEAADEIPRRVVEVDPRA